MTNEGKKGFLGLKALISNIKTKVMGNFLTSFFASIVEKLKVKHPKIFVSIVGPIALGLQFGFNGIIDAFIKSVDFLANAGINLQLPEKFLSLDWILATFNIPLSDGITDIIMAVLMLLTGVQSKEFLAPEKRDEELTKQQQRIQRREMKAAIKEKPNL